MQPKHALRAAAFVCLAASLRAQALPFSLFDATVNGSAQTIDCTTSTPCAINVGGQTLRFQYSPVITAPGGSSDTVYEYIDALNPSTITVGTNTTVLTCGPGTTCRTGIKSFPVGSYPLYAWPIQNGLWRSYSVDFDKRAMAILPQPITAGPGISITQQNGQTVIGLDCSSGDCGAKPTGAGGGTPVGVGVTIPPVLPTTPATGTFSYQIINQVTGKCLQMRPDSQLAAATCSTSDTRQLFSIIPETNTKNALIGFQILSIGGNTSWNVWGNTASPGATIGGYPYSGDNNELFLFQGSATSGVEIQANNSGLCADLAPSSGATLTQQACVPGAATQQFLLSVGGQY